MTTTFDTWAIAQHLRTTVTATGAQLHAVDSFDAEAPWLAGGWNRLQLLGHLIDSAVNNLQRFVRLQWTHVHDLPGYVPDEQVAAGHYDAAAWWRLIALWQALNHQVAHVIEHLDPATLGHAWHVDGERHLLIELIRDYVAHLEHHVGQLVAERGQAA